MSIERERFAGPVDDQRINRIFECGLVLAAIANRPDITDEQRQRLLGVIAELDDVIRGVRRAAFAAAHANAAAPLTAQGGVAAAPELAIGVPGLALVSFEATTPISMALPDRVHD